MTEKLMRMFNKYRKIFIIVLFGLLLILILHFAEYPYLKVIKSNESVASLLLSALLVILYFVQSITQKNQKDIQEKHRKILEKQSNIQEKQTEIMVNQERWMEANHVPKLSIEKWKFSDKDGSMEILISNHGNGPAFNPVIKMDIKPLADSTSEQIADGHRSISYAPPDNLSDRFLDIEPHIPIENVNSTGQSATIINPTEEPERFTSSLGFVFMIEKEGEEGTWVSIEEQDYFNALSECGVSEIHFILRIEYSYLQGSEESFDIWGGYTNPDEVSSFVEMVAKTDSDYHPENSVEPEFPLSLT